MRPTIFALASALAFAGCGPGVGDGNDSGGTTGDTEDSGTSAPTATDTSGADSTGPFASCEEFFDEAASSAATIEIRNVGTQTLLFGAPCFGLEYLQMTTPSALYWPPGFCTQTCEQEFASGCIVCGAGCAEAAYTLAAPGDVISIEWDGRLFEPRSPPQTCFDFGMCGASCEQARADYDETISLTVDAITQAECLAVETDPTACQCEAGGSTTPCQAYGSTRIEPTLQASVDVAPGTASIVVEIGG